MSEPLLRIRNLRKHFRLKSRTLFGPPPILKAVDGVDLEVRRGEALGLVGESGCGKTTTVRLILRLIEPSGGEIEFDGMDVRALGKRALRRLRRQMQLVFQDPLSSLNPRMGVGVSIAEPLRFHGIGSKAERYAQAREMFETVGLSPESFDRLPHEFSGGQCQRVGIARALILQPKLVILDEPVSALDVSIRAQILNLLLDLQKQFGLTYLFISHDLSVVKRFCERTAVLYLGRIAEFAESERLYREPLHPYTQALIGAIPVADPGARRAEALEDIAGDVPSPVDLPKGCRFHTRCPHKMPVCTQSEPELREARPGHWVACFLYEMGAEKTLDP
ncbi:MAG TPA: ABC transporter ATP-binding protein [Alphaproteobacteria bacterium]|nr:ABC transporter ATP-binding protein [Alphaproteobacteria bacterium]